MGWTAIIDTLRLVADWLSAPPALYGLTLAIFILGSRTRFLWRRPAGVAWLLLVAALLAVAAADPVFRERLLDPRNAPVAVWSLATLGALWLVLHRARREPAPAGDGRTAGWPGPSGAEWRAALAAGIVLMAVAFFIEAPLGAPRSAGAAAQAHETAGAPAEPAGVAKKPWFLRGFQEAGFYFDPWVASWLLPALLLITLLALPYVDPSPGDERSNDSQRRTSLSSRERRLLIFLAGTLFLLLLPMLVATFLRDSQWNVLSPLETWRTHSTSQTPIPLSELFWCDVLGRNAPPAWWWVREAPGLLFLVFYLAILPWQLPRWKATRGIFGRYRQSVGPWRYHLALILALLLLSVPLKMSGRWLLDVSYWLHLPEISWSF